MSRNGWTIDELAQRAADTLTSAGVRSSNGRVSAVPDRRVIRWYATIGLLDRPLRTGGRAARYGERHLLQLIAVKRRQAQGRSLTEIQAELAGATDATLRRIAGLPPGEPAGSGTVEEPIRPRFWAEPAPLAQPQAAPATAPEPAPESQPEPQPEPTVVPAPDPVYPLTLHPAATLVLTARPAPADLAAIQDAARPLLDLLATRGLLTQPRRPS